MAATDIFLFIFFKGKRNGPAFALGVLVFLSVLFAGTTVQAQTFRVSTEQELHDAINAANTNSNENTIILENDIVLLSKTTNSFADSFYGPTGLPFISSDIIIDGAGYTLGRSTNASESELFRLIYLSGGQLTLNNITLNFGLLLTEGKDGGLIFSNRGHLKIVDSTLKNSRVFGSGGAIANIEGTVEIINSVLHHNVSKEKGGHIYNTFDGSVRIENSTIAESYNEAFVDDDRIMISEGNLAGEGGGAIYNDSNSTVTAINSSFIWNFASGNGGSFYNNGTVEISNSTFKNNGSYGNGGAFYNTHELILNNVSMGENSVDPYGEAGGRSGRYVYNDGGSVISQNSLLADFFDPTFDGDISCFNNGDGTITTNSFNLIGYSEKVTSGCPRGSNDIVATGGYLTVVNDAESLFENTITLIDGSPAIDASGSDATRSDQKGKAVQGSARDIGSLEFGGDLVYPIVEFAGSGTVYENTAGEVQIPLRISGASDFAGEAVVYILDNGTGTAVVGEQYQLFSYTEVVIDCSSGCPSSQTVSFTVLDGGTLDDIKTTDLKIAGTNGFVTIGGQDTFTATIIEALHLQPNNGKLYVDQNVSEGGDQSGSSWGNAVPELNTALAWTSRNWDRDTDGDLQIWVTAGTYKPTRNTDRSASFTVIGRQNGLEILGGFSGSESAPEQRVLSENKTILSGDIGTENDPSDNSYHVLLFDGTEGNISTDTVLESVTVTGGNANGSSLSETRGGGLYCVGAGSGNACNPSLRNVIFTGNHANGGGAIYNNGDGGDSSPLITGALFYDNTASDFGGAILNNGNNGGASSPQISWVTFFGNSATDRGGAIHNSGSNGASEPQISNIILFGNTSSAGDEMYNFNATPTLSYSLLEGGLTGSGVANNSGGDIIDGGNNINTDPQFVDTGNPAGDDEIYGTADDGLIFEDISPAINMGDPATDLSLFPGGPDAPLDLAGNPRVFDFAEGGMIDIGAYEYQGEPSFGTPSVVINGNPGWRMMGVPIPGVTVGDLAGLNLVQGISGLPQAVGESNLYLWANGSYVPAAGSSTVLQPGTGFIWYMYGSEANLNLPESKPFPLTMELTGSQVTGDVGLGTLAADWYLIANPFFSDIRFDQITDGTDPLGVVGSVWDPNEGAAGSYILTTSSSMNNKLAAWQGAFIELASQTQVVIPQSAKTTGAAFFKERPLAGQVEFILEGSGNGGELLDKAAILYFSERATPEWDGYDVTKLTPFSQSWASVNLIGNRNGESVFKSQHSLPYDFTDSQEIPVTVELQNTSGDFILSWPVVNNLPPVDLWLLDRQSGERYDLTRPGRVEFTMQNSNKEEPNAEADNVLRLPQIEPLRFKQNGEARFVILINPEELPEELPTQIALNQNYPNPFNPTTVISYQLPVSSEVRLEVYDMLGRNVATLVNDHVSAGRHTVNFDAGNLSSGIYLYRLQAGSRIMTRKLTVVK